MSTYRQEIEQLVDGLGNWFADERAMEKGRMTGHLYPYEMLFSPIEVGPLKLKNRIVMGPMGNVNMAEETGRPGAKMIEYLVERARGGTGLICTGLIPVDVSTDPSIQDSDDLGSLPRIDRHRTNQSAWRDLADGCHAHGSAIFIQLTPGLGRVGNPECVVKKHRLPVSASWNPSFWMPVVRCRPLLDVECRRLIKNAGQAAADAKVVGMDGVYLHGHEGYLLDQLTSPAFNRRRHGRYADWQAFGLELVRELRRRCGERYPIMYRIDLTLALRETYGDRMDTERTLRKYRNGRTVEMTLEYMENLVKAGVDLFDVDLGCYDNWWLPHPPYPMPPGVYLRASRIAREYFEERGVTSNLGKAVPVVAVGKLGFPDLAERALRDGMCDMVMLARPLLADPFWPRKAYAGRVSEIIPCIGDQEGCLNQIVKGGHLQCAVNPRTAFEDVLGDIRPAAAPKHVAVVGAGPAGVYCACHAAERGHRVTLFEQGGRAGGKLIPGSVPRMKFEVANFVEYLNDRVLRCVGEFALEALFGTEATLEVLENGGFDVIVFCTGSTPASPPVDGVDLPHVVSAVDLLNDPALADGARAVVVVGGGDVGCEVASMLAGEKGKRDVTVLEMLPHFMRDSCPANRGFLIHHLELAGVKLMNCSRLNRVTVEGVEVVRNVSRTVPDPYNTWVPLVPESVEVPFPFAERIGTDEKLITLKADLVVLSTGSRPDDGLYYECLRRRTAPEVHNIGDSMSPGMVLEATRAGFALGTSL